MACKHHCDLSPRAWALRDADTDDLVHELHTTAPDDERRLAVLTSNALAWVAYYAEHGRVEQAGRLAVLFRAARFTAINAGLGVNE
jgi:hypothetical protein